MWLLYPSTSDRDSFSFIDDKREINMSKNDFVGTAKFANSFDARKGWTDNINSFGYDHIFTSRVNQGLFSDSPNSVVSFELPNRYKNKQGINMAQGASWEQGGKISVQVGGKSDSIINLPVRSFHLSEIFQGRSN